MNMKEKAEASILIVDDNIGQCKTMAFILERNNYAVTIADNGPEAISMVEKKSFDIIFMDIKMPIMNGVDAYKQVKKIRPGTKVIMMTAYAVEELVQEALQEGAYAIIYKPLDIEKVLELVKKAIEAKQGALILVVDDDPGTCTTLKNILVKKSYNVGVAYTGEEAISMVQKKTFDILFIDIKLPTLNGLETYLAIKNICPETVSRPVVKTLNSTPGGQVSGTGMVLKISSMSFCLHKSTMLSRLLPYSSGDTRTASWLSALDKYPDLSGIKTDFNRR